MIQINSHAVDQLGCAQSVGQSYVHTCCGAVTVSNQSHVAGAYCAPCAGEAGLAIGEDSVFVNVYFNLGVLYGLFLDGANDAVCAVEVHGLERLVACIVVIIGGDVQACQGFALCKLELQSELQAGFVDISSRLNIQNAESQLADTVCNLTHAAEILPIAGIIRHNGDAVNGIVLAVDRVQEGQLIGIVEHGSLNDNDSLVLKACNIKYCGDLTCFVNGNVDVPLAGSILNVCANQCFQLSLQFCHSIVCASRCKQHTANGNNHSQDEKGCKCLFHVFFLLYGFFYTVMLPQKKRFVKSFFAIFSHFFSEIYRNFILLTKNHFSGRIRAISGTKSTGRSERSCNSTQAFSR